MKIHIVGSDPDIQRMWILKSKENLIVDKIEDADVIQFIGGADINPELYGEKPIERTSCDLNADKRDMDAWNKAKPNQLKVGICRG